MQDETAPDGIWSVTEIEVTARDIVDVGIWESAEEEERALVDSALTLPDIATSHFKEGVTHSASAGEVLQ